MLSLAPTHWPLSTLWTLAWRGTSRLQMPGARCGCWWAQRWGRQAWAKVVQPGGRRDPPEAS